MINWLFPFTHIEYWAFTTKEILGYMSPNMKSSPGCKHHHSFVSYAPTSFKNYMEESILNVLELLYVVLFSQWRVYRQWWWRPGRVAEVRCWRRRLRDWFGRWRRSAGCWWETVDSQHTWTSKVWCRAKTRVLQRNK